MTTSARGLSFAARTRSTMPTTGAVARTVIALAETFATTAARSACSAGARGWRAALPAPRRRRATRMTVRMTSSSAGTAAGLRRTAEQRVDPHVERRFIRTTGRSAAAREGRSGGGLLGGAAAGRTGGQEEAEQQSAATAPPEGSGRPLPGHGGPRRPRRSRSVRGGSDMAEPGPRKPQPPAPACAAGSARATAVAESAVAAAHRATPADATSSNSARCVPMWASRGDHHSSRECAPPPSPPRPRVTAGMPLAIGRLASVEATPRRGRRPRKRVAARARRTSGDCGSTRPEGRSPIGSSRTSSGAPRSRVRFCSSTARATADCRAASSRSSRPG